MGLLCADMQSNQFLNQNFQLTIKMPRASERSNRLALDDESNESIDTPPNEYTLLLPKPIDPEDTNQVDRVWRRDDGKVTRTKLLLTEFWKLTKSSVPVILAYTLQMSLQTATVVIIGHSSPMNLAVSAFSMMFALVTGWMIALGGTTALDTLASSTFTGSGNKHDLGILLQRAFVVLGLLYIPVGVLWACSNAFFRALGQDPVLSYQSSRFLTVLIPGGLGYIYFETMKKFLQAQGERKLKQLV
jgi:MATE family multidrug resistance protein